MQAQMLLKDRTIKTYQQALMEWKTKLNEHIDQKTEQYQNKADLLKIKFDELKGLYDDLEKENESQNTLIKDLKAKVSSLESSNLEYLRKIE